MSDLYRVAWYNLNTNRGYFDLMPLGLAFGEAIRQAIRHAAQHPRCGFLSIEDDVVAMNDGHRYLMRWFTFRHDREPSAIIKAYWGHDLRPIEADEDDRVIYAADDALLADVGITPDTPLVLTIDSQLMFQDYRHELAAAKEPT